MLGGIGQVELDRRRGVSFHLVEHSIDTVIVVVVFRFWDSRGFHSMAINELLRIVGELFQVLFDWFVTAMQVCVELGINDIDPIFLFLIVHILDLCHLGILKMVWEMLYIHQLVCMRG